MFLKTLWCLWWSHLWSIFQSFLQKCGDFWTTCLFTAAKETNAVSSPSEYDWKGGDQVNIIETFGHLFIWLFRKDYFDPSDYLLITKKRKISLLCAGGQNTRPEMSKLFEKQNRKQTIKRTRTRTWTLRRDSSLAEYVSWKNLNYRNVSMQPILTPFWFWYQSPKLHWIWWAWEPSPCDFKQDTTAKISSETDTS